MKKLFVIAAAACVTFASCVKNEPVATPEQGDLIAFESPVLAPNVKATAGKTEFGDDDKFKVWAYMTEETMSPTLAVNNLYIPGEVASKEGSVWATATDYYWPNQGYITFVGCAPSSVEATVTTAGLQIASYTADGSGDLLVSDILFDQTKQTSVTLPFFHALSAIKFNVATDITGLTVTLKGIDLLNVEQTGKYSQLAETHWTVSTTNEKTYTAFSGTQAVSADQTATTENTAPYNLILLPQELDDIKLKVTYSVKGSSMENAVDQVVTVDLKKSEDDKWDNGKCYTYNLTLHLDKITFTPEVVEWTPETPDAGVDVEE